MKRKLNKILIACSCAFLSLVMLFVIVGSNFLFRNFKAPTNPDAPISNGDSNNNNDNNSNNDNNNLVTPPVPDDSNLGDYELSASENFVYSLIYADLTKQYDTFIGYVPLTVQTKSNGLNPAATTETVTTETYGISYVDYEEAYIDENGKTYFSAGFISFPNEPTITESNIENGLEIVSLEEETDEQFSYIYTYNTEDVHMHCIIDNKYVKYDIVDGTLQYQEEPFIEGMEVDDSRGNIYSYDIEDYVYIIEEIDYVPVSGVSIVGEADYQAIMDEVNRILETQEANFTYAQIEQFISHSQDALISYLLGLQEETFFGYATTELIETAKNIDPMQHLQIGVDENGNTTINLIEVTKKATLWEKICTSVICVGAMVGGIALSIVGSPVLGGAAGGMIIGAAMEAFSQVVLYDTPTSDIQWAQVGVAAVAGALAGASSGYLSGVATKGFGQLFIREATDLLCDGFIGGTEFFVNSLIGGTTFEEAVDNFGAGLTAGVVLGSIFKIGSATIKSATLVKKSSTSSNFITEINGSKLNMCDTIEANQKAIQKRAKKSAEEALRIAKKAEKEHIKLVKKIAKETGWSSDIISNIKNMDQYKLLKSANLTEVDINGKKCLIRNDIDWKKIQYYIEGKPITNKDLIKQGLAPYDNNGKSIELHHLGQKTDSPLVELTMHEHRTGEFIEGIKNQTLLHDNGIKSEAHGEGNNWNQERKTYWEERINYI